MRQRNVQLNIRLTEVEMETLERDAAAHRRSKSEHVRRCLGFLQPATDEPGTDGTILRTRYGWHNLNKQRIGGPIGLPIQLSGALRP